jgi:hypothetical protein
MESTVLWKQFDLRRDIPRAQSLYCMTCCTALLEPCVCSLFLSKVFEEFVDHIDVTLRMFEIFEENKPKNLTARNCTSYSNLVRVKSCLRIFEQTYTSTARVRVRWNLASSGAKVTTRMERVILHRCKLPLILTMCFTIPW